MKRRLVPVFPPLGTETVKQGNHGCNKQRNSHETTPAKPLAINNLDTNKDQNIAETQIEKPVLVQETQVWRDMVQERAAIVEFEGNQPHHEAEAAAYKEVLLQFVTYCYPAIRGEFDAIIQQPELH